MKEQIRDLFSNTEETLGYGLWFSGYDGEGKYKSWYDNGQVMQQFFYKNGKENGEHKQWYEDGQPWQYCFYKNGYYDGEYKSWFGDNREIHCFYKNGKEYTIKRAMKLFPEGPWIE